MTENNKNGLKTTVIKRKDNFKSTGYFPKEVYQKIPESISRLADRPDHPRRTVDVILFSLMVLLSSCIPTWFGVYFGKRMRANLYGIIGAPPASGKGSMLMVQVIGDKIHTILQKENEKIEMEYSEKLAAWEKMPAGPKPAEPKRKLFFIPGNISAAGITMLLWESGRGVIFEAEIDSIKFNQQLGNFSDLLRKSFHHEPISSYRKTGREYFSIPYSILTILLSGTPEQLTKLIRSAENGLFSRIAFYVFDEEPKFSDPFSEHHTETTQLFEQTAEKVCQNYFKLLEEPEKEFRLTEAQRVKFLAKFPEMLNDYYEEIGSEGVSVPVRMGLVFFRIAMTLTAIRNMGTTSILIYCNDDDFEATDMIVDVLLNHSLAVYSSLPSNEDEGGIPVLKEQELLSRLPHEFESKRMTEYMLKGGYSKRSAFRALRQLAQKNLIEKIRLGWYRKK